MQRTLTIGMLLLVSAGSANGDDEMAPFDPLPGFAPRSIVLEDSRGTRSGIWVKDLPCSANRASVTVKFDKAYQSTDNHWMPVAKVILGPHSPHDTVAAAVIKAPTDAFGLNGMVWLEKDTGPQAVGPGIAPTDLHTPMKINIAWTPTGEVSANFGGDVHERVSLDRPINEIAVSVSWAKFEFLNLTVGHAGPPNPACAP
jgi:hypothetical protein